MKCKHCGEGFDAIEVDKLYGEDFSSKGYCRPFCYTIHVNLQKQINQTYINMGVLVKEENACAKQLNEINLNDYPRFKFQTDDDETGWIELNLDTLTALNAWLGRPYVLKNLIDKHRRKNENNF